MRFVGTLALLAACADKAGDTGGGTTDVPTDGGEPPVVGALSFGTDEDTPLDFTVVASDPEGAPLTLSWVGAPSLGVVSGTLPDVTYTPNPDANGSETLVLTASDGTHTVQGQVTIDIRAVNDPPVAAPIADLTTPEDTPVAISIEVSDADGDSVTVTAVAPPAHGQMSGAPPTLQFLPEENWSGTESVVFDVSDGTSAVQLTFDITVTPVNDAPVAVDDGFNLVEDEELVVAKATLISNDMDLEADPLSFAGFGTPSQGDIADLGDDLRLTPPLGFVGIIEVPYTVSDGLETGEGKLVAVVSPGNDAPTGAADAFTTDEDQPLGVPAPGVLANDTDPEGDPLHAVLVDPPTNGAVSLDDDGAFVYTPDPDYSGADAFTYEVNDGALSNGPYRVDLTVDAVNDDPIAVDDALETFEDTPLLLDGASGVLTNDFDVDGDPLNADLLLGVLHGELTLDFDGGLLYVPDPGYNGSDDFVYQVTDDFGGLSFGGDVFITIHPVEDLPTAVDDAYAVAEDGSLEVGAPGLLANDADDDGDGLTVALATPASNGSVSVSADGSFSYTPAADWSGNDQFEVDVSDGKGTVRSTATVTVTPVNDPPVANAEAYDVTEGVLVVPAAGVLANDTDIDGDPLTAALVTSTTHGVLALAADGSFVYIPDGGYAGLDSFSYAADDGPAVSAPATVVLTVVPPNEAPIAVPDLYAATAGEILIVAGEDGVLANDTDPEGLPLEAILVVPPLHGDLELHIEGSFDYTPDDDFAGVDMATYIAVDPDGEISELTTISFVVTGAAPEPPVAVDDHYDGFEDTPIDIAAPGVLANDVGSDLVATLMAIPLHGAVTLDADGGFSYGARSPLPEDYAGIDVFSYVADNADGTSNMAVVELDLAAVDDAPRGNPDFLAVEAGSSLALGAPGVLANDADPEGDPISVASVADEPDFGVATLAPNGALSYTPDISFTDGVDTLTYVPVANGLEGDPVTVSITVFTVEGLEADRPPLARPDRFVSTGNFVLEVDAADGVLANDFDPDLDPLAVVAETRTTARGGSVVIDVDGGLAYTPPLGLGDTVDRFDVTVVAGAGAAVSTVEVALVGRAWWVDGASDGNGRSDAPLASLDDALAVASAGDVVRIVGDGDITAELPVGVTLLGAALPLSAAGHTLEAAGLAPVVSAPGGLRLPVGVAVGGFVLDLGGSAVIAHRGARLTALDLIDAGPNAVRGTASRHADWSIHGVTADGALSLGVDGTTGFVDLADSAFFAVSAWSGPDGSLGLVAVDSAADGWSLVAEGGFVLAADAPGECVDTDLGAIAAGGNTALDGGPPDVTASGLFQLR